MMRYAKGVACAASGRLGEAERHRRRVRGRGRAGARVAHHLQQHLPGHPRRGRGHAGRRDWSTARGTTTRRSPTCAARSSSTTGCPTTSRGAGCSRPGTPTARCCSSRAGWRGRGRVPRRPRPGRHPGPGLPAPWQRLEPARLPRMPGSGWASTSRLASSGSSSRSRARTPTCRSAHPAIAGLTPRDFRTISWQNCRQPFSVALRASRS